MMRFSALLICVFVLTACTKSGDANITTRTRALATPQSLMVHVAKRAQACWFAADDPAFRKFKLATEVNSFSGKPRILIVPRNKPTGLPQLVAQAERIGGRNNFTTFGPLLANADGTRFNNQLRDWARGGTKC